MSELNLHCPDIECEGCASSIQRSLGKLPGVQKVSVEIPEKNVHVQYAGETVTEDAIRDRLAQAGYPPAG